MSYKKIIGSLLAIPVGLATCYALSKPHEALRTVEDTASTMDMYVGNLNDGNILSVANDSFNDVRQRNPVKAVKETSRLESPYSSRQPHRAVTLNSSNHRDNQEIWNTLEDSFENHEKLYLGSLGALLGLTVGAYVFSRKK